ncbi:hypothetical protein EXIGLDRAFT_837845 [Exidia glandulosa HHB12029]|uniref:Ubiquitin-like protease family profile domain-containing protein n=1 Tax=Exidia glandulosa HHB12029 TaxID=1314781 RepID=A0A165GDS1_EXIGL|nr:hypothetical protein EXIGLDRAFT_837845 [Exidia glandulosa HHB12029]
MPRGRPRRHYATQPKKKEQPKHDEDDASSAASSDSSDSPPTYSRAYINFQRQNVLHDESDYDASEPETPPPIRLVHKPTGLFKSLKALNYSAEAHWRPAKRIPTAKFWKHYDSLMNDFGVPVYAQSTDINVHYHGHPLDRPRDIRARPFFVEWATPNRKAPKGLEKPVPVLRITMNCTGSCELVDSGDEGNGGKEEMGEPEVDEDEADSGDGSDSGDESQDPDEKKDPAPTARKGRKKCLYNALLSVEVMSDDLATAIVRIRAPVDHPEASPEDLEPSHYLRHHALECALMGQTASKIQMLLRHVHEREKIPTHRQLSKTRVQGIVQTSRRAERKAEDPLRAIEIYAEENEHKIYLFERHDPSARPPKKFSVAIADAYELETLMLFAEENGICLDSSWRHKNENRAPLTMLATVNNEAHFVPGAAYLSENAQAETIAAFLSGTKDRVEKYCQKVINDPDCVQHSNRAAVLQAARAIVEAGEWNPCWFMIDKDKALVKAILAVWPDAVIRLCQFHVIQAILRWHTDAEGNLDDLNPKRPRLTYDQKRQVLDAFRSLQRCRSVSQWSAYVKTFTSAINNIMKKKNRSMANTLIQYFERNWFTDFWRDRWTDIGLPKSLTRDAPMLNTNNWIERAFKTIDQTFLDARANKRIDRLVLVLAEEFFPFYQYWEPKHPTRNADLIRDIRHAHRLWSAPGMVEELSDGKWRVSSFREGEKDRSVREVDGGALVCKCKKFDQTGRACAHVWAVRLLVGNGAVENYQANEIIRKTRGKAAAGVNQSADRPTQEQRQGKGRKVSDYTINAEIDKILGGSKRNTNRLDPENDPLDPEVELEADSIFIGQVKQKGGRPSKVTPLHPTRSPKKQKTKHKEEAPNTFSSLRFSQKHGPVGRLHNSLLVRASKSTKKVEATQKTKKSREKIHPDSSPPLSTTRPPKRVEPDIDPEVEAIPKNTRKKPRPTKVEIPASNGDTDDDPFDYGLLVDVDLPDTGVMQEYARAEIINDLCESMNAISLICRLGRLFLSPAYLESANRDQFAHYVNQAAQSVDGKLKVRLPLQFPSHTFWADVQRLAQSLKPSVVYFVDFNEMDHTWRIWEYFIPSTEVMTWTANGQRLPSDMNIDEILLYHGSILSSICSVPWIPPVHFTQSFIRLQHMITPRGQGQAFAVTCMSIALFYLLSGTALAVVEDSDVYAPDSRKISWEAARKAIEDWVDSFKMREETWEHLTQLHHTLLLDSDDSMFDEPPCIIPRIEDLLSRSNGSLHSEGPSRTSSRAPSLRTPSPPQEHPLHAQQLSSIDEADDLDRFFAHASVNDEDTRLLRLKREILHPREAHILSDSESWINDEIINMWRAVLSDSSPSVYISSSFFYARVCDARAAGPEDVEKKLRKLHRWFKDLPCSLLAYETWIIPVNLQLEKHWIVAVVERAERRVTILDSMKVKSRSRIVGENILWYLEHYAKEHQVFETRGGFYPSQWKPYTPQSVQQQQDAVSCGVFACWFMSEASSLPFHIPGKDDMINPVVYRKYVAQRIVQTAELLI